MTDMDSVNDNKDELLLELLKDLSDNDDYDNDNAGAAALPDVCCVICATSTDLAVIFTLCKHLNMCTDCYDTYVASKRAEYEDVWEGRDGDDVPPFVIQCPSCRAPHEPHQIISGIYKP